MNEELHLFMECSSGSAGNGDKNAIFLDGEDWSFTGVLSESCLEAVLSSTCGDFTGVAVLTNLDIS